MYFANVKLVVGFTALLSSVTGADMRSGFRNAHIHDSQGGSATCVTGLIPLTVTSPQNYLLNVTVPADNIALTQQILSTITPGISAELMAHILASGPTQSVTAAIEIGATLCEPKNSASNSIGDVKAAGKEREAIQVLTHGIGFDRSYWDFQPSYSYADCAAKAGATTLFYDRLGVGQSSHPDPLQIVQAPFEVAVLHALVSKLKTGEIGKTQFAKVVSVGHSFGSAISVGLAGQFPRDVDGVVLTGFTLNQTGMPLFQIALNAEIARLNDPSRFSDLPNGYIVSNNIESTQLNFFHFPGFEPQILRLAEQGKQTVTVGELLTLATGGEPATEFDGVVSVVNGAYDLPFCSGNCDYPNDLSAPVLPTLFPKASKSQSKIYANTAHGINLHKVAPQVFLDIQAFLKSNNL